MRGQILGRLREGMSLEIGRRRDDRHSHLRPNGHSNHVFRHLLAHANARIIARCNDIRQAVVDSDFDVDIGVIRKKSLEGGLQHGDCGMLPGRDPDGSGRFVSKFAASSASISSKRGAIVRRRRSPASVGATLRVVRVKSRIPSRSSRFRTVWLSADGETRSFAAARVKLRSRATAPNATRSLKLSIPIC